MKHPHTTRHNPLRACLAALLLLSVLAAGRGHAGAELAEAGEMAAVTPPADAQPPAGQLAGRLELKLSTALAIEVLRDDYALAQDRKLRIAELPDFAFDYVQDGAELIPLQRGLQRTAHPHWDLFLEPGGLWRAPGDDAMHASLPFALQEKNANCTHNGVLHFRLHKSRERLHKSAERPDASGEVSPVTVLIGSETCQYLKFNLRGQVSARFHAGAPAGAEQALATQRALRARRLPVKPLVALQETAPAFDIDALAGAGQLPREDLSAWGLVVGDTHYASGCPTRLGPYPFCDALSLPSYSLAKSLVGGLGLMRLEQQYPGSRDRRVSDLVSACGNGDGWQAVTLEHSLNMVTGHYGAPGAQEDEASEAMLTGFFNAEKHAQKIRFACSGWPRRAPPGETFVYHSSDTYLLGTAMTTLLRQQRGDSADLYNDVLRPLWRDLGLSPALADTRRSRDTARQPFTGYGLTLLRDDIARLARALNRGELDARLDTGMLAAALQRGPHPAGIFPSEGRLYYQHGFWAYDAAPLLGCDRPLALPFMSGYGGINVLLLPGDMVYYYFSDGGRFAFADALLQINQLRPLCAQAKPITRTPT
ncbi:serine hydrolase [Parahaliea mediterranea]|uniref:Serine hydrolase n=1 Tax=Parahaliea mediterranea TaxID=651086 RepID=A0A939IM80_9GAMM|nr:serine hydrolase [Parahaliea mediterranea]MBN7799141.1 serine hydrolase [Parahaliea mediterranea]